MAYFPMENQEGNNGLQARQFNFPSYMAIINPNSVSRAWSDLLFIAKMAQNIEKTNKQTNNLSLMQRKRYKAKL